MRSDLNDYVNGESVGESIGTVLFDSSIDSREGEMLETIYCNWTDCLKFSCNYGSPLTFIKNGSTDRLYRSLEDKWSVQLCESRRWFKHNIEV